MPVDTADQQLTTPIGTDAADNPVVFIDYTADVETRLLKRYTGESDRTTRNPTPPEGELHYLLDVERHDWRNGAGVNVPLRPLMVRKTADETVNNSATMQNDDHLLITPPILNSIWELEMFLMFNSGATPDLKIGWTGPTGSSIIWSEAITRAAFNTLTGPMVISTAGAEEAAHIRGTYTLGGTAGALQLQWAQNTANASNTIMRTNSWLRLRHIS